ncbi:MAG: NUDIX hydrolase, partial [bacterium]
HKDGLWVLKKTYWFKMRYEGEEQLIPQVKEEIKEAAWLGINELQEVTKNSFSSIKDVLKNAGLVNTK